MDGNLSENSGVSELIVTTMKVYFIQGLQREETKNTQFIDIKQPY